MDPHQNFTDRYTPGQGGAGGTMERPIGTGDNGETWDPTLKRWVPRNEMPAVYRPAVTTPSGNLTDSMGNPTALQAEGTLGGAHAWGGVAGLARLGPDGKTLEYDPSFNGAKMDTDRYQGMAAAAGSRPAYQNDYTQANEDRAMSAQARSGQGRAMGLARDAARGGETQAGTLGQRMLQQGAQTQQAAAMSARGGGLAQAAAMRQQQGGQAAYMQQGANQLQALRADEMAAGRQQYMQQASAMRGMDAQSQGLAQQQAINQMGNEIGQRQLNDQRQHGYEGLGYSTQAAQQDAGLKSQEIDAGIAATNSNQDQAGKDRDMRMAAATASTVGTALGGAAKSDERVKQHIRPMSLARAAAARKGGV
jgi:hypothetical protein